MDSSQLWANVNPLHRCVSRRNRQRRRIHLMALSSVLHMYINAMKSQLEAREISKISIGDHGAAEHITAKSLSL